MPRVLGWIGFAAHLATFVWYAASGLLAPGWAVGLLLLAWAALTVVAFRLVRGDRPLWTLVVPVADAAVWFGALSFGESVLGWTG
ncbi:hypothetical protein KZZ52_48825 [Dactylosporangium sp. AC04546]|uniref:hypothetical protein n=1 Tax=Dactylosporangium sp. AC04546 TaxID=2862460 RepID=UPI001EDF2893|nr:hypothetical protein [Dactylosporangium sp. AC04546]WVK81795.1 hypothetical protein KZZ52_48825 [Dactylosporangium sp. AC04546]